MCTPSGNGEHGENSENSEKGLICYGVGCVHRVKIVIIMKMEWAAKVCAVLTPSLNGVNWKMIKVVKIRWVCVVYSE